MNQQELHKKFLSQWANQVENPHFAVLIEGQWGCGKTHFIKSLIQDSEFTEKDIVYTSIFGMENINNLEEDVIYKMINPALRLLGRGSGIIANGIKAGIDATGVRAINSVVNTNVAVDNAKRKLLKISKKLDNAILVIDDVERCSFPYDQLLGYLNNLVEHRDTRILLVANAEKINDRNFILFREKIIGHSIKVTSDNDAALRSFISDIKSDEVRDVIERNIEQILKLHLLSEYNNLRALRQFIWQLNLLIEKMEEEFRNNELIIDCVITQYFIFFFEYKLDLSEKSMNISMSNLIDAAFDLDDFEFHTGAMTTEEYINIQDDILKKYDGIMKDKSTIISIGQWNSILSNGVVDSEWLNKDLKHYAGKLIADSWPSWKRLWHLYEWDLENWPGGNFCEDIEDLKSKIKTQGYNNIGEFLHASAIYIELTKAKIIENNLTDTINDIKSFINHAAPRFPIKDLKSIINEHSTVFIMYEGLGFTEKDTPEFREITDYLYEKMREVHEIWINEGAGRELIKYLEHSPAKFLRSLTLGNYVQSFDRLRNLDQDIYLDQPILHTIKIEDFVKTWSYVRQNKRHSVIQELQDRYQQNNSHFIEEIKWWIEVTKELRRNMKLPENTLQKAENAQIKRDIDHIQRFIIRRIHV